MTLSRRLVLPLILLAMLSHGIRASERIHIVARGDTVFSLSRSFGVSQDELMRRNGMSSPSQLQIGMRLVVPQVQPPVLPPHSMHTVAAGETLFSIARARGVTLADLRAINGFEPARVLLAGERIRIPEAAPPPQVAPPPAPPAPVPAPAPVPPQAVPASLPQRAPDPSVRWPIQPAEIAEIGGNSRGVLLLGLESESVRSVSRGTVMHTGPWRGYGNVVIVSSVGGFNFLYGMNESISVRIGDTVDAGTEVGKLGINPASGRPELVFMAWRNGIPVDPATVPRS